MTKRTTRTAGALALASMLGGVTLAACAPPSTGSTLTRSHDPVVLTGSQLTALNGLAPGRIAAFATAGDGWTQIPVQVDERFDTTMDKVYNLPASTKFLGYGINVPAEDVYADPNTFVGPDPTPTFDADDELVFMSRDAGGPAASRPRPAGTTGGGIEVRVNDPSASGTAGYVYLFPTDGSIDPGAGRSYVDYQFRLNSGDYKSTYRREAGPNPETSTVKGVTYEVGFTDRWSLDSLKLSQGDSPGTDIIERVKYDINLFCVRHEGTFNAGEGAFITNKVGPVRALRSWVGANSGPATRNTHAFYDTSIDITVNLRVHGIPNVGQHIDFNRNAFGMTFRNPQVPNGVTIDGQPDNVPKGAPSWYAITGSKGSVSASARIDQNATAAPETSYEDDLTPATDQCSKPENGRGVDGEAIGDAGARFPQWINCTNAGDPDCPNPSRFVSQLRTVFTGANDPAAARTIAERNLQPLTATVTARN